MRVRIRFAERFALHVEERVWHPSQKLEPLPDGGVELALEVGGLDELQSWVLSFGTAPWCSSRLRCASTSSASSQRRSSATRSAPR